MLVGNESAGMAWSVGPRLIGVGFVGKASPCPRDATRGVKHASMKLEDAAASCAWKAAMRSCRRVERVFCEDVCVLSASLWYASFSDSGNKS